MRIYSTIKITTDILVINKYLIIEIAQKKPLEYGLEKYEGMNETFFLFMAFFSEKDILHTK